VSADVLRMPRLSDSMTEATIVAWLKRPGETFNRGEPLVEVETDKATVVYEAETDGFLAEILVTEGVTASLGEPIARLGGENGDEPSAAIEEPETAQPLVEALASAPAQPVVGRAAAPALRARATPVARRTAVQLGVALHGLTGTGPGGRIRQLDVLRAGSPARGAQPGEPKGPTTIVPLTTTGETIARRMAQSRTEIPSFEVVVHADLTTVVALRRDAGELVEPVPSVNDFVVKAVNASFVGGRCERHGRVNVGVAVATDDSLLVPAVMDADRKPLAAIAADTRDLVARARARRLTPDELTASTFTVSNLGMFDVRSFTAVINAPQVAILAVGAAARTPVESAAGRVTFRDVATLTLTSDHRAVYGADAARFLGRVRQLLEHPLALVLERPHGGA
jgi:pyruvate dehydrogenase E2 component (dihydrolipoamide acetyltransferase)